MRFNWRLASIALTLLPVVAATGCTGDKVIQSGNGRLELQLVVDPAVGPRAGSKPPFNYAKLNLAAVTFTPTDPVAPIVFGPYPLQILLEPTQAEMVSNGAQSVGTVDISAGSYVMGKVFINGFDVNSSKACSVTTTIDCTMDDSLCPAPEACLPKNEPPLKTAARCIDGVLEWAAFLVAGGSQQKGVVPTNQPVFEIRAGEVTVLRVLLDGATLTPLLEQNATCSTTTNGATLVSIPATSLGPMLSVQLP